MKFGRPEEKVSKTGRRAEFQGVEIKNQGRGLRCKAQSAMQGPLPAPQTRSTATALAVARSGKQNLLHANATLCSSCEH